MPTDYRSIKYIRVQYAKHPKVKYKGAHLELNRHFSLSLDDIQDLYTDENRTDLQPQCVKLIREKIITTLQEYATSDKQDPTKIPSRFNGSMYSCTESESGQAVRQNSDILHALNIATEKKKLFITIRLSIDHLDFKHEFSARKLDTWGPDIDTSDDPKFEDLPPETPISEPNELMKTFTESIKELTNLAKAQSPNKKTTHTTATAPTTSLEHFNIHMLPPDVRQRYDTKTRGELLCQNEMKPFRTNIPQVRNPSKMQVMHYYLDPPVTRST